MQLSRPRMSLSLLAVVALLTLPVVAQTAMLEGSAPETAASSSPSSSVATNSVQLQSQKPQYDYQPSYPGGSAALPQGSPAIQQGQPYTSPRYSQSGNVSSIAPGALHHVTPAAPYRRPVTVVRAQPAPSRTQAAQVHTQPAQVRTVYVKDNRTFWQKHPMVKGATIGAGVGAGAGALTGLVTGQGVLRGAVIGSTAGAGVGVIRTSKIMKRHPIARDVATGAVSGLGLGWAGSRWPHTVAATTGVGAAIGLGAGLLTHLR